MVRGCLDDVSREESRKHHRRCPSRPQRRAETEFLPGKTPRGDGTSRQHPQEGMQRSKAMLLLAQPRPGWVFTHRPPPVYPPMSPQCSAKIETSISSWALNQHQPLASFTGLPTATHSSPRRCSHPVGATLPSPSAKLWHYRPPRRRHVPPSSPPCTATACRRHQPCLQGIHASMPPALCSLQPATSPCRPPVAITCPPHKQPSPSLVSSPHIHFRFLALLACRPSPAVLRRPPRSSQGSNLAVPHAASPPPLFATPRRLLSPASLVLRSRIGESHRRAPQSPLHLGPIIHRASVMHHLLPCALVHDTSTRVASTPARRSAASAFVLPEPPAARFVSAALPASLRWREEGRRRWCGGG